MILWISIIFVISFLLALKSAHYEFVPPEEVKKIKITRKKEKGISGVILFLKKKIIHYSSNAF